MNIGCFDDLVGNTETISVIRRSLGKKAYPQLSLLSGIHGVGKSSVAVLIALALTCEDPQNGEACQQCITCKKNLIAFKPGATGVSPRVEKVNMALIAENSGMKELIKSTFHLQRSDGIYVKIFEEFHSLSEDDQRLMLEETSRLPLGMYVILTTTHANKILDAMESRCLTFSFGRLNRGQSMILIDRVNTNLRLRAEDYKMIFRKTGGIPRDTVLLLEFLSKSEPTAAEIDTLLGNINSELFIELFESARAYGMYMDSLEALLSSHNPSIVLRKVIDFFVQIVFALEGQIYDEMPKKILARLPFTDSETVYKMIKLAESAEEDERGAQLAFMKMRRLIAPAMTLAEQKLGAEIASNVKGSSRMVSEQKVEPLERFKP